MIARNMPGVYQLVFATLLGALPLNIMIYVLFESVDHFASKNTTDER